jgi:hypothetical protein
MVFDSASIAHSITADCGAGHRGAAMLFSSRLRPPLTILPRSSFTDSAWATVKTSTVKTTIGEAAEGPMAAGTAPAKAEIQLPPYDCGIVATTGSERTVRAALIARGDVCVVMRAAGYQDLPAWMTAGYRIERLLGRLGTPSVRLRR